MMGHKPVGGNAPLWTPEGVQVACLQAGILDALGIASDPLREDREEFFSLAVKTARRLENSVRSASIMLCMREEIWDQSQLMNGLSARIELELVLRGLDRLLAICGHGHSDHGARKDFDRRMRAWKKSSVLKGAETPFAPLFELPRFKGWFKW